MYEQAVLLSHFQGYLSYCLQKRLGLDITDGSAYLCYDDIRTCFFSGTVYRRDLPYYTEHPDELERIKERFVGLTEGMTFTELDEMRLLCKKEEIAIRDLCTVVDLYKYAEPYETIDGFHPDVDGMESLAKAQLELLEDVNEEE